MGSYISIQFNKEKLKGVIITRCHEFSGISPRIINYLKKNPKYIEYIYNISSDIASDIAYVDQFNSNCSIYEYFYSLEYVGNNTFRSNTEKIKIAKQYTYYQIYYAMRINGTLSDKFNIIHVPSEPVPTLHSLT
jgi:hypothetical protein